MFSGADAFNHDVGGWNPSRVTSMFGMFSAAVAFKQEVGG